MKVPDNRLPYQRRRTSLIHGAPRDLSGNRLGLSGSLDIARVTGVVILTRELLKSLAGSLGNEEGGGTAEKHEEGKDLEDVVEPRGGVGLGGTTGTETGNGTLTNDGTNLTGGGRDTVRGRTVTGREDFTRNDEGGCVGAKVEEELSNDVDGEEAVGGKLVVSKAHDNEEDGEDDETSHLDRLAAESINGGNRDPVARDGTSQDDDDVADSGVVEKLVDVLDVARRGRVADSLKNGTVVQGQTVESDIKTEPRTSGSEKEEEVLALAIVAAEITEAGLGDLEALLSLLVGLGAGNLVRCTLGLAIDISLDIVVGLLDIASNIEGVTGGLGDGKTV